MYTITFYSFKGGVGRTMALVNVGMELVRRGRRVLLVDFDLEAPGLTTYSPLRNKVGHPGVVEFVTEYIRTRQSPDVSRFMYSIDLDAVGSRHNQRKARKPLLGDGRLWVMPAGKGNAAYSEALAGINWNELYERQDGYLFFEDTKLQWKESIKPDYVLIDSRTGHTDVGGICTRQLADAVVLLFTPNEQNELGLRDVCHDIRAEEKANGRSITMHLVMSNVSRLDDEVGILRRRVRRFLNTLQFPTLDGTLDRYESLMHLDQRVFVLDRPRSLLAKQYRSLVRNLILRNPEDREGAITQLGRMRWQSDHFGPDLGVPVRRSEFIRSDDDFGFSETTVASSDVFHASGEGLQGRFSFFVPEKLQDSLRRITDSFSNDQEIMVLAAELHTKASNYETALALLDRSLQIGESPETLLLRSRVQFQLGRKDRAVGAEHDLGRSAHGPGDRAGHAVLVGGAQQSRGQPGVERRRHSVAGAVESRRRVPGTLRRSERRHRQAAPQPAASRQHSRRHSRGSPVAGRPARPGRSRTAGAVSDRRSRSGSPH